MVSIRDVNAAKFIDSIAEELPKHTKMPEWALYVKTGVSKERLPEQANWWYIRSASILRKISLEGPVGVSRLRTYYGSLHRRGHKPAHFAKGSGKIIRTILQDFEKIGYIENKKPKGRAVTKTGQKFLNQIAKNIALSMPKSKDKAKVETEAEATRV